jgi:hypothetical protein
MESQARAAPKDKMDEKIQRDEAPGIARRVSTLHTPRLRNISGHVGCGPKQPPARA